jgi:type 1 glutamine amidotransferase
MALPHRKGIRAVLDEMRTLVLCGDHWHPPRVAHEGLRALQSSGFVFDWIEDARDWSPEIMSSYRSVILTKSNNVSHTDQTEWMTDDAQGAFLKYVQSGNGLLAIHSGTAEYERKSVLRALLGGVFTRHPDPCPVTIKPRMEHPLCTESGPFTLQDEHYFMALDDPQAEVFMTTASVNGEQPGGWRREVGNGRVAVLTPGHNLEVWLHPSFQALLINSLRWCSKLM